MKKLSYIALAVSALSALSVFLPWFVVSSSSSVEGYYNASLTSGGISGISFIGGILGLIISFIGGFLAFKQIKLTFIAGAINFINGLGYLMNWFNEIGSINVSVSSDYASASASIEPQFGLYFFMISSFFFGILTVGYLIGNSNDFFLFFKKNKTFIIIILVVVALISSLYIIYISFLKPCDCNLIKWNEGINSYVKNDKVFSGKCIVKDAEGNQIGVRLYKNGLRDGLFQYWYDNGNIESDIMFINNQIVSRVDYYEHENNKIKYEVRKDSLGVYDIKYFKPNGELIINLESLSNHRFDMNYDDLIEWLNTKKRVACNFDKYLYSKPGSFQVLENDSFFSVEFFKDFKTYELVDGLKVEVVARVYSSKGKIAGIIMENSKTGSRVYYSSVGNFMTIEECLDSFINYGWSDQKKLFGKEIKSDSYQEEVEEEVEFD